jgi:serine/threonine protein kinase
MSAEYTLPKFLSAEAKDLIQNIFITDPDRRYGIDEIRNHPWYRQVQPEVVSFGVSRKLNSINNKVVDQLEQ